MSKVEEIKALGIFTEQEIETAIARANEAVTNLGEITINVNFDGDWSTIFVDEELVRNREQETSEKRKETKIKNTWNNAFTESIGEALELKVKDILDDQFLDKLKFLVRSYGWSGDFYEVADFACWCYKIANKPEPKDDIEPFL